MWILKKLKLKRMSKDNKYDKEPVSYCMHCLDLGVMQFDNNIAFCRRCGCTGIKRTNIFLWEEAYEKLYGHPYIKQPKTLEDYEED